jgi:methionyl-tRNA synthetase
MVDRYRDGTVPQGEPDPELAQAFDGCVERVCELLDRAELTQALGECWKLVRRLNQYVEERRPWDLAKDEARSGDLDGVLYNLVEGLRVATLLLHPYVPESAERLLEALAEPGRELAEFGSRGGGQAVEKIPALFPKLEPSDAAAPA